MKELLHVRIDLGRHERFAEINRSQRDTGTFVVNDPRHAVQPQLLVGETPNAARVPSGCRFHPRCPLAQPRCAEHTESCW